MNDDHQGPSIREEMLALQKKYTVAIVAGYEKAPHQHATGTLVRIGDNYLVVTASHAIKQFRAGKEHYKDIILMIDNYDSLVELHGDYFATDTARDTASNIHAEDGDDLDIAVWKLHDKTRKALTKKSFIFSPQILPIADLSKGEYFLAGFPCEWSRFDAESGLLDNPILHAFAIPHAATETLGGFNPRLHAVFQIDQDWRMPDKLVGISGCSIWQVSEDSLPESWHPDLAKIVAVQTGTYNCGGKRIVKGTKWQHVIHALTAMFPSISPAFGLWLPRKK